MRTFTQVILSAAMLLTTTSQAQYCMLPGRTPYAPQQPGITNFKLNTINRTSGNSESNSTVVVETGDTTTLVQGHTYTVSITHSQDAVDFPGTRNNIRVWLDYNGNKDYTDANETVISSDFQTPGTFTGSFTVPSSAPLGFTMLRATAKMSSDAGHTIPTPCDNPADPIGYHGEMEDYVVKIVSNTAVNEVNAAHGFLVFPNPAAGQITISLNEISNKPMGIDLYDVTGKLIGNLLNTPNQSVQSYNFDLNNYTNNTGVYFIKVSTDGNTSYQKVLKVN